MRIIIDFHDLPDDYTDSKDSLGFSAKGYDALTDILVDYGSHDFDISKEEYVEGYRYDIQAIRDHFKDDPELDGVVSRMTDSELDTVRHVARSNDMLYDVYVTTMNDAVISALHHHGKSHMLDDYYSLI